MWVHPLCWPLGCGFTFNSSGAHNAMIMAKAQHAHPVAPGITCRHVAHLYSRCQMESCLVICHSALNLFSMAVCADAAAAAASAAASAAERAFACFRLGWVAMVGAACPTAGRLLWLTSRGRTAEPATARTTRRTVPSSRCRPALRLLYVDS